MVYEFMNQLQVVVVDFDGGRLANAFVHHVSIRQTEHLAGS